jgi:hypothetical protein
MSGIQRWLPIFVEAKGFYLLPAAAGALVVLRFLALRSGNVRALKSVTIATAALAMLAIPVWFNFFNYHYGGFVNPHEFFHYYLGSKYAGEIGYFEIYDAALVADDETGLAFRPPEGHIMDLTRYGRRSVASVLADRERIKARFTPARWQEWVHDITYFKRRLRGPQWSEVLRDMGYNGTPVWSMLAGTFFSERVSTDSDAGMTFLALLDVVLLAAAAGGVAWAFDGWTALLMIVFLASSYLMAHVHMKGAFLRTDFVVALVVALCLIRKGRHRWAGALVGYSALARIFPAIFLFGPGVKLAGDLVPVGRDALTRVAGVRARSALVAAHLAAGAVLASLAWLAIGRDAGRSPGWIAAAVLPLAALLGTVTLTVWGTRRGLLDSRHLRFFSGFAIATGVLLGASILQAGGFSRWEEFGRKMAVHRTVYNHWNLGVTSVVIAQFDPAGPRDAALAARPPAVRSWLGNAWFVDESVRDRAWLIVLLQIAALAASWLAARRVDDASAFAFGFVLTFYLTAPTYYYYIILLIPFLYFAAHPDRLRGTLGLLYLFLMGGLGFAFYFQWDQYFTTYYWNSVLVLALTIGMTVSAFGGRREVAS